MVICSAPMRETSRFTAFKIIRFSGLLVAALVLWAAHTTLAQSQFPRAPGAYLITISPSEVRASEPSIAVNPYNPAQVVAAFQPASVAYSSDGGRTFHAGNLPPVPGWREGGDVSVTFDNA